MYLSHDEVPYYSPQTPSTLNLAQVSRKQRQAVLEAFSYHFIFPMANWRPWAHVFRHHLRSIHCADISYPFFKDEQALQLLSAPTLRHALISNRPVFLNAVSRAEGLRSLAIEFWDEDSVEPLLSTLEQLNLTKLHLDCGRRIPQRVVCALHILFKLSKTRTRLAAACTKVHTLTILCSCTIPPGRRLLSPVFEVFPNLQRLTTNRDMPNAAARMLGRKCKEVELQQPGMVSVVRQVELAGLMGDVVRGLVQDQSLVSATSRMGIKSGHVLKTLGKCGGLERLHLNIRHGAETEIVGCWRLSHLQVRWFQDENEMITEEGEVGGTRLLVLEHYRPPRDFMRWILRMTPSLKELCLFRAEIGMDDVNTLLRGMGEKLEVFGSTFTQQLEPPLERVLLILEGVIQYNPGIQKLELEGVEGMTRVGMSKKVRSERTRRILRATERLRTCAPYLDVDRMFGNIVPWIW